LPQTSIGGNRARRNGSFTSASVLAIPRADTSAHVLWDVLMIHAETTRRTKRTAQPLLSPAAEQALAVYTRYLREEQDVIPATLRNYLSDLRQFLAWCETATAEHSEAPAMFALAQVTTPTLTRYRTHLHSSSVSVGRPPLQTIPPSSKARAGERGLPASLTGDRFLRAGLSLSPGCQCAHWDALSGGIFEAFVGSSMPRGRKGCCRRKERRLF
jgi:hypothetical protein